MNEHANTSPRTIQSRFMRTGDRIVVEAVGRGAFEATVLHCRGWGLVHNVMEWAMQGDDGEEFVYDIHVDAPVQVVAP